MAAVYLSPVFGAGAQLFTSQGVVLAGGTINTYLAGSTTPQITYTDHTGGTSNGTSILLDSAGRPPQEIWIPAGVAIKIIVKDSNGVQVGQTYDWVSGVNDPSGGTPANTEWVTAGTPTFISTTQFSVVGDQHLLFPVGQRVRYTVSAGTGYGTVTASAFSTVTTVTVQTDSIPLDSGMSVIAYGLFNAAAPSISAQGVAYSSLAADTSVPSVGNTLKRVDRGDALTTTTGTSTALVLTPAVPLSAYATNAPLLVKFGVTSGANPTMNVSGLGALNLKQINGAGSKVAAAFASGQIAQVVYDGADLVVLLAVSGGRLLRISTITASGTYTKGTDANSILVRGVGGGGGVVPGSGSGGGGAGGYFEKFISSPAATYTIGIGAGGTVLGGNGGNTTFDTLCTAVGGTGNAGTPNGGAGGTSTGGDINITGGGGGWGGAISADNLYGAGGNSFYGGGAAGILSNGAFPTSTGIPGAPGSGGGASGAASAGAIGGSGRVDVYEYS